MCVLTSGHSQKGGVIPVHVHAVTQGAAGLAGVGAQEHIDGAFGAAQIHL